MLAHIDFAEALEEGEKGNVQPLVGPLHIPLLMETGVADCNEAKDPHTQIPVQQLL